MTLSLATWLTSTALILMGIWCIFCFKSKTCIHYLRSRSVTLTLMVLASGWFLLHVASLGEADFGLYKKQLILGFGTLGMLSVIYVPDFLSVRALAVLGLLIAHSLLQAAFMQAPASKLWLVAFSYAVILISLVFAALPYLLRNVVEFLEKKPHLKTILSAFFIFYGSVLAACAWTY